MKSQSKNWVDPFIALLFMMNALLFLHSLHYASVVEQSGQFIIVLFFYRWLSQWAKRH